MNEDWVDAIRKGARWVWRKLSPNPIRALTFVFVWLSYAIGYATLLGIYGIIAWKTLVNIYSW